MRFVSFNVNSIRVRLPQLEKVISTYQPEIIGLQETKVTDEDFPTEEINAMGYHAEFYGQKTHYGVAILSKNQPEEVTFGLPTDDAQTQRRFIECKFNLLNQRNLSVINCTFPKEVIGSMQQSFLRRRNSTLTCLTISIISTCQETY